MAGIPFLTLIALLTLPGAPADVPADPPHPLPVVARAFARFAPGPVLAPADTPAEALAGGGTRLGGPAGPRAELSAAEPAPLVMVLSPHGGAGTARRGRVGEASLYTRESFGAAWSRVEPGGWLVWIAGDEQVFLRGIMAIWEARAAADPAAGPIGREAWGWRLIQEAAPESPYRLLCLVPRGGAAEDVLGLSRTLPLRELFGPGADVKSRYVPLSDPAGPASARALLRQQFSGRAGEHLLVDPATDDGPPIFEIEAGRPLPENVVLAVTSLFLLAVLLLPLNARRHVDSPESGRDVPFPVRLGEAPLGAVLAGVGVALAVRAVTFRGGADLALFALPASAAAGLLFAWLARPRVAAIAVGLLAALVLAVGPGSLGPGSLAPGVRLLAGSAVALGFGLGAGSQLRAALAEADAPSVGWMIAAWITAAAGTVALAGRLVHDLGAARSATVLAVGWAVALAGRVVLARARR